MHHLGHDARRRNRAPEKAAQRAIGGIQRGGGATEQGGGAGEPVAGTSKRDADRKSRAAGAVGRGTETHRGTGEAKDAAPSVRESQCGQARSRAEEAQEARCALQSRSTSGSSDAYRGASDQAVSGVCECAGRDQRGTSATSDRASTAPTRRSDVACGVQRLV